MTTVYVAETSADEEARRDKLVGELEQYGVTVLPSENLPESRIEAENVIRGALEKSKLSIHLIGQDPIPLGNEDHCLMRLQFELASELATEERPILAFLKDDPQLDSSTGGGVRQHNEFLMHLIKQKRPVRMFYSYAHKSGREHLEELIENIAALRKHDMRVVDWCDSAIKPGEPWDKRIGEALENSDLAVFFVSPPWLNSRYVLTKEFRRAIELGIPIVPILVKDLVLKGTGIDRTQMIPRDKNQKLVAINDWKQDGNPWKTVAEEMRKIVEEIQLGFENAMSPHLRMTRKSFSEFKELVRSRLNLKKPGPAHGIPGFKPNIFLTGISDDDIQTTQFRKLKKLLDSKARLYPVVPESERDEGSIMRICDGVVFLNQKNASMQKVQHRHLEASRVKGSRELPKCMAIVNVPPPENETIEEHLPSDDELVILDAGGGLNQTLLKPFWEKFQE